MQKRKAASFLFLTLALLVSPLVSAAEESTKKPGTITAQQFMQSSFGDYFRSGDYPKALEAIEDLLGEYPNDPLLRRYKAMTLTQMGRTGKAIPIYQQLLKEDPSHAPTHYFFGEALMLAGQKEDAAQEWQWIVENAAGSSYAEWSRTSLKDSPMVSPAEQRIKRWFVVAKYGYEYDTNVTLKPNDKSLASATDEDAGRQALSLDLRYRAYSKRDLAVDLEYQSSQSFHDDSLNEFNFHSEDWGISARKKVNVLNRDVILGARYQFSLGILDTEIFSRRNQWTLSADTRLTKYSRTVLYDQIALTNFGPNGFNPSRTSRDGVYNDVGFTHYIYSKDFKRYIFFTEELNTAQTRGGNFDSVGNTTRIGVHTPLVGKFTFDGSAGLQYQHYPNFTSLSSGDLSRRRDLDWDFFTAISYWIRPNIAVRGIYRYIRAFNRNNFFDYSRHIIGGEVIFAEAF